jgi:bifunctional enzyme CysN/CysC
LDVQTGKRLAANNLEKNGIGACEISLSEKTVFSTFEENHTLGGFILIDRISYNTAACGMIRHDLRREHNLTWQMTDINREIRAKDLGQQPKTLWFTGLSGSGKSTLANGLEKALRSRGLHTMILDGDNVRMGLNRNLGFTEQDRVENIRRIAEVAKLMNDAGLIVLTAVISPYLADRQHAREIIGESDFIEIYVKTSLEICESRDVKGLYKKARQGFILNFTGVSAPYEPPLKPEIVIDTEGRRLEESLAELLKAWDIYMETQYGCI